MTSLPFCSISQTFDWKELANLNKMSITDQESWLLAEKNFVLVEIDEEDRIYKDTTSLFEEELWLRDSVSIYFFEERWSQHSNKRKKVAIDYYLSKTLSRSLRWVDLYTERDSLGRLEIDGLYRMKYGQELTIGGIYDENEDELLDFASAEILREDE
jgi:hypothetical protein